MTTMTMTGPRLAGVGAQLARQGTQAMYAPGVQYGKDQARIGESYLGSIESQSQEVNEKVVAHTARRAWTGMEKWHGQVAVAAAALNSIAAGVGGPLGTVLAKVGSQAMYNDTITTIRDQAEVGLVFAAAVRDNTVDATQKAGAEAALKSASHVSTARAQVSILGDFLVAQSKR